MGKQERQLQGAVESKSREGTSLKWVLRMILGQHGCEAKCRRVAHSSPMPSALRVPLPNSSMMHRDLRKQKAGTLDNKLHLPLLLICNRMTSAGPIHTFS